MLVEFTKMSGAGNDFVLIDNRNESLKLAPKQIVRLCDRHRGVGADGVMILVPCKSGKANWAWNFFNSDGSSGEMCGNGARCFARFVQKRTEVKDGFTFETGAGVIKASFRNDLVTVDLTAPQQLRLSESVSLSTGPAVVHSLNTGVPHAVIFVPAVEQTPVLALGEEIRRHSHFAPKGTNVNFVEIIGPGRIKVRTFERGVEGETLACGTGVTAAALIAARLHQFPSPVQVRVQGGDDLEVSFQNGSEGFSHVRLTGPADFVFEGKIQL